MRAVVLFVSALLSFLLLLEVLDNPFLSSSLTWGMYVYAAFGALAYQFYCNGYYVKPARLLKIGSLLLFTFSMVLLTALYVGTLCLL